MSSDIVIDEEDVRALAYRMWEDDGRPDGRAEEYWFRALDSLRGEADSPPAAGLTAGQLAEASKLAGKR